MDDVTEFDAKAVSIACGTDDRFAIGLAVTLYSALSNITANSVNLFIIDGGVSEETKTRISRVLKKNPVTVRLSWIAPSMEPLRGLKVSAELSVATYFRILLPSLLPKTVERVIYLDSDLVVEGNLEVLWNLDMGDYPVLAVQDFFFPTVAALGNELQASYRDCRIPPDAILFNAGVMLIDLKQWRAEALDTEVFEFLSTKCYRHDQDGLNAVFAKRWKPLDLRWNVQQVFGATHLNGVSGETARLIRQPLIMHYTFHTKPWHRFFRLEGGARFNHYLRRSGWFTRGAYLKWLLNIRIPQLCALATAKLYRLLKRRLFRSKRRSQAAPA